LKIIFKTDEENQNMINEGASTSKIKDVSLNDICYEQIKDNYYYCKFGEFRLVVDKNTGCFNATKLCKEGNKDFNQWKRLERVKELLKYVFR
jgi:hypothetical protein